MSMKPGKDLQELVKLLNSLGYYETKQSTDHTRLTRKSSRGVHNVTILKKDPLKFKSFSYILLNVASHTGLTNKQIVNKILIN